jgi:hypothetical protein
VRSTPWTAAHQQKGFFGLEAERRVEREGARVERVLNEAHASRTPRTFEDRLHEPPPDAAALEGRFDRDRSDGADRAAFRQEVGADHPPVALRDHSEHGGGGDQDGR